MVNDNTIMWFGDHKGKKLANVPDWYLRNLYRSGKAYGDIKDYIEDNLETIDPENTKS